MKLKIPNLPLKRVRTVAIGEEYPEFISLLQKIGIKTIIVPQNNILPKYERSHADMRLHHIGDNKIICYKEDEAIIKELEAIGFEVILAKNSLCGEYPQSAALNALRIGNILVLNKKCADKSLVEIAEKEGLEIIDCKQGYSRCAACIVSENAVITADKSIYNSLKDKIDVLLISAGNIRLADTNDGMIGGASFMIEKDFIFFCGDLESHPDYIKISEFLTKHSVNYCFNDKLPLTDIGSAILLESE